ncbi:hypothetical protein AAHH63_09635 [Staphylococcus haemolyticus]
MKNGKDYVHSSLFTYTTWLEKSLTITSPSMTSFVQKSEIVNLLLFDIFIYNKDRNLGNLLIEIPKNYILLIILIFYQVDVFGQMYLKMMIIV